MTYFAVDPFTFFSQMKHPAGVSTIYESHIKIIKAPSYTIPSLFVITFAPINSDVAF